MNFSVLLCVVVGCCIFIVTTTTTTSATSSQGIIPCVGAFVQFSRSHHRTLHRSPSDSTLYESSNNNKNGGDEVKNSRLDVVPGPEDTTEQNIRSLFVLFNNALATGAPKLVAKRYAKDAVLLPSTNVDPVMTAEAIEEFYADYLLQKPQKRVLEGRVRVGYGWSEDAGICEISLQDPVSGLNRKVKARYSFVYVWESHQWKILQHHSSILGAVEASPMCVPSMSSGPMTTQRVENLFQLMQDAWEIRDADAVARRFVDDGLLMPLDVYEAPKRGFFEIRDYMEEFLQGRPMITNVARTQVIIDPSIPGQQTWAKDVGTFEITFRKDGSILHARYSLFYILDGDGVWKISQFTVSPLPQDWKQIRAKHDSMDELRPTVSPPRSTYNKKVGNSTVLAIEPKEQQSKPNNLPPKVSKEQVRQWFSEWNNAMATGDPSVVAHRYAAHAVLMTTMSRKPKTTLQEIQEFYQLFLWNRPQAKALESFVTISEHWCKDVGVLEYVLRDNDGHAQRVKERYSFLYTYDETSGWKIAHHHSSIMPQELQELSGAIEVDSDNDSRFFQ
ncbi:calcium/calmodulin dependent protein kinase II association-domain containing protein [Nitzschia inconspicua]|uniref:Calcium/calmodulin dependent protein kinase II association-domain containing protein n=1 Tax=Nitzschia inconspicua TaxID=303405 RepID=A0A9K3PEE0_9STRA|nr:calcium/calmodulin dependent protein kinase II association-domain containing protein [Nitzschia inconspicua]